MSYVVVLTNLHIDTKKKHSNKKTPQNKLLLHFYHFTGYLEITHIHYVYLSYMSVLKTGMTCIFCLLQLEYILIYKQFQKWNPLSLKGTNAH